MTIKRGSTSKPKRRVRRPAKRSSRKGIEEAVKRAKKKVSKEHYGPIVALVIIVVLWAIPVDYWKYFVTDSIEKFSLIRMLISSLTVTVKSATTLVIAIGGLVAYKIMKGN